MMCDRASVEDRILDRCLESMGDSTARQYRSVLHAFRRRTRRKLIARASKAELTGFINDPEISIAIRRRRLSALRMAYAALLKAKHVDADHTVALAVPRKREVTRAALFRKRLIRHGYTERRLEKITWADVVANAAGDEPAVQDVWIAILRRAFPGRDAIAVLVRRGRQRAF